MWNKKSKECFRNEWKYLISTSEKDLLELRMRHILKKDPHAGDNGYMIRSLYFEDYFNSAYDEKESGILMRKKYRIRIYDYSDRSIKLERKKKYGSYIYKESAPLTKEEFYNPRKCTSFQYQIPTYTSDIEFALEYIKNVIDKNIPLIRELINNVQTVDDAITVLNQRIVTLPHIYVPYMCHIRAFLYAKNNDIDNAIESIKQGYENSEIPQVIIDKLVQIANG